MANHTRHKERSVHAKQIQATVEQNWLNTNRNSRIKLFSHPKIIWKVGFAERNRFNIGPKKKGLVKEDPDHWINSYCLQKSSRSRIKSETDVHGDRGIRGPLICPPATVCTCTPLSTSKRPLQLTLLHLLTPSRTVSPEGWTCVPCRASITRAVWKLVEYCRRFRGLEIKNLHKFEPVWCN